jgi:hypothetical protein
VARTREEEIEMPTAHPGRPAYSSPDYQGYLETPYAYDAPESFVITDETTFGPITNPVGIFDPASIAEAQAAIDNFNRRSYGNVSPTSFNPNDMGLASYFNNVWAIALERAKQGSTTPKIYTYEEPPPTGTPSNTGIIGWFAGIPEYFINLREQDKIEWIEHKKKLEERRESTKNPEGQEVISDTDVNDPWVSFWGASGEPSAKPSAVEKIGNTWDEFTGAVVEGWEEGGVGGIGDYKYPLLIAGGVILLILIIK